MTLSNGLSFFRVPLAFLFLQESPALRLLAILLAMITDSVDGYLARRNRSVSRLGAILDPTTDKFFVYFALIVLFFEGRIFPWEVAAMLSRDFFLCLYGASMFLMGRWKTVVFRAIRWGKATTALQFIVLSGLVFGFSFSWITFGILAAMGALAFLELIQQPHRTSHA